MVKSKLGKMEHKYSNHKWLLFYSLSIVMGEGRLRSQNTSSRKRFFKVQKLNSSELSLNMSTRPLPSKNTTYHKKWFSFRSFSTLFSSLFLGNASYCHANNETHWQKSCFSQTKQLTDSLQKFENQTALTIFQRADWRK